MTVRAIFRQADLERIFIAAQRTSLPFQRIELAPDGTVRIIGGSPAANDDDIGAGWEDA